MFKVKSVKGGEFKILNKETKEVVSLLSVELLCKFIEENDKKLNAKFIGQLLSKIEDEEIAKVVCRVSFRFALREVEDFPEKQIYRFLSHTLDVWDKLGIKRFVTNMKDSLKLDFFNSHSQQLSDVQKSAIIEVIESDKIKLQVVENNINNLEPEILVRIMRTIDNDKMKISFIEKNEEILGFSTIVRIVPNVKDDKFKERFIKDNKGKIGLMNLYHIVCSSSNDKLKLKLLAEQHKLSNLRKRSLMQTLSFSNIARIYINNEYDARSILFPRDIIERLGSEKERLNFIDKNLDLFSNIGFEQITNLKMVDKSELLKLLIKNRNRLSSCQLSYVISNSEKENQLETLRKFNDKIDPTDLYALLLELNKDVADTEIDNLLAKCELPSEVQEFINRVVTNLGLGAIINPISKQLLTQSTLTGLGEDNVFYLFKYCVVTNALPDMSIAMENSDLFKQYQEFRKQNLPVNSFDFVNIQNTIVELNEYYNLIQDCFNRGIDDQERDILVGVVTDKCVPLDSKEDLHTYASKRSEYIDKMAEIGVDDAIIYIITGMGGEDFYEQEKDFISNNQLGITLNDFGDELQEEILIMQACKSIIDLIKNEPFERKQEILQNFKYDLEQEFSTLGSKIACARTIFPQFIENLRSLYGKELAESLSNSKLPTSKIVEDVEVIELKGEDFKLLVHGLNAYGAGSSNYENRDLGRSYLCTSLISNNHLARADAEIYYGFKNISKSCLALEGAHDIWSGAQDNSLDVKASRGNLFNKTDALLQKSQQFEVYNEVVLYRDQVDEFGNIHPIMPDYIVTFKEKTDHERAEAKRLKIPIVLIDEAIYEKQIEESKKEQQEEIKETVKTQDNSLEIMALRDEMLSIIAQAKNNCTARQQEAIMNEVNKEFKLSHKQNAEVEEVHNV